MIQPPYTNDNYTVRRKERFLLLSEKDALNYALENGMIDMDTIREKIEMNERKRYLEEHKYEKWQGKDGKFYTYLPDEQSKSGRKLLKRTTETSLDDAIVEFYKGTEKKVYCSDVFSMWIDEKLKYGEIKKQSYDKYTNDFHRFFDNSKISQIEFIHITEDILEDFIKSAIHDQKLTAKGYSGLRIIINGMFRYAKKHGYTKISITQFMGDLMISSNSFQKNHKENSDCVFTADEECRIFQFVESQEPTLLNYGILLAFETGLRCGELSSLEWNDISDGKLRVHNTEIKFKDENGNVVHEVRDYPKTEAGFREIILTDKAKEVLRQIRKMNPFGKYIFMKNGKRMIGKVFTSRLYRVCDALGIKRRSLHKARKTYATKLIDGKVPDSIVQDQLGHSDISTTLHNYYFNSKSEKEKELAVLRALG